MGTAVQSWSVGVTAPAVLSGGVVYRRALLRRLERAGRVVQVSAPAGSGKTVLPRSWIGEAGLADSVAWVSVESAEHDPRRLWVSLADGLRGTIAGSKLVRPPTAVPDHNGWAVVQRLLEDLGSLEDRLWLVIDDLHELRSADALAQLESGTTARGRAPRGLIDESIRPVWEANHVGCSSSEGTSELGPCLISG